MRTNRSAGPVFRGAVCLIALCGLLLGAASAWADGKFYPPKARPASINIPDQSALLIWSNGVERLVIETRFVGEGTNFAWVVPLPSVPKIEPATTGLFPTLRTCLQPVVRHTISNYWAIALFVCSLFWLMATVRSDKDASGTDVLGCLLTAAGAAFATGFSSASVVGFLLLSLLLILFVHRVRNGENNIVAILGILLLVLVGLALFLPALGSVGRGKGMASGGVNGVQVLDRKIVGVFETAVISGTNSQALLQWLDENGFAADKSSGPVIDQHVRDGWVFATAKVHRDVAQRGAATPHPLSFTFKTAKPVYPLRLTGTGSDRLGLDLFVVGQQRAKVDGFKVTECHWLVDEIPGINRPGSVLKMNHRLFKEWAGDLPVLTRLEASLTPAAMSEDATISWREFAEKKSRVYSTRGAAVLAANWAATPIIFLVVTFAMIARNGRTLPAAVWRSVGAGIMLCALLGPGIFLALPKVEIRFERGVESRSKSNLMFLGFSADDLTATNRPVNVASVRQAIIQARAGTNARELENPLQGGVMNEEDSPGNYTLRETEEGVEFVGHDSRGGENVVHTIKPPAPVAP